MLYIVDLRSLMLEVSTLMQFSKTKSMLAIVREKEHACSAGVVQGNSK